MRALAVEGRVTLAVSYAVPRDNKREVKLESNNCPYHVTLLSSLAARIGPDTAPDRVAHVS